MPRFYFHLRAGGTIQHDLDGDQLPDLAAAYSHAEAVATELMRNTDRHTCLWSLRVEDEHSQVAFNLFFAEVASNFDNRRAEGRALSQETCWRLARLTDVCCSARDTIMESAVLLARATGKPQLVFTKTPRRPSKMATRFHYPHRTEFDVR